MDGDSGAGGESTGDSDGEVEESVGVGEGGDEVASGGDAVGEVADDDFGDDEGGVAPEEDDDLGGVAEDFGDDDFGEVADDDFGDDADPDPEGAGEDFGEAVGEVDGASPKAVVASKEIRKKTVTMLEDIVDDFDLNFFSAIAILRRKKQKRNIV
ncbi:unnamed protein product [Trifolium pratense]|uniref:Uncharacterized protein n=1 Tax=Trifolium pratense TaxID=57577 RepID=A0ACB0J9Z4_TRIPR|nr:unnamed protein product [Trifolium pratense]